MSLRWLILDEVESTQDVAKLRLDGDVDVVFAHHQTAGRGRFDRVWESERGASLTMSLIVREPLVAPAYLYAMAFAVTAAEALDVQVQWPNDLVLGGRKVGGILAEVMPGALVIGIGLNLRKGSVPPELAYRAGFLRISDEALEVGERILAPLTPDFVRPSPARGEGESPHPLPPPILGDGVQSFPTPYPLQNGVREGGLWPSSWTELADRWHARDATAGKRYQPATGGEVVALGVTKNGALRALRGGEETVIFAADALFG